MKFERVHYIKKSIGQNQGKKVLQNTISYRTKTLSRVKQCFIPMNPKYYQLNLKPQIHMY